MSGFILFTKDERALISFEKKHNLEGYMESPEVLDGLHVVFDEEGNIYDVDLDGQGHSRVGSLQSSNPGLLTEYLRTFLAVIHPDRRELFNALTLSELVGHLKREKACCG